MKQKKRVVRQSFFPSYQDGGIHINPDHEGAFTAFAQSIGMGVQAAAAHVLANRGQYSPMRVQQANFARNAAKWEHADGSMTGWPFYARGGLYEVPSFIASELTARKVPCLECGGPLRRADSGGSIVDYLGRQNVDASFDNRKKLYNQYFDGAYKGTADQNSRLLELLQSRSAQPPAPEPVVPPSTAPALADPASGDAALSYTPFFQTVEERDAYEKRLGDVANRALWWGDDSDFLRYTSYHPTADGNDCINGVCGLNLKAGLHYSHPTDEDRYLGNTKFTESLQKGMEDYYQTYQPRVGTHLQKLDENGKPFHSMLVYKIDRDEKGKPTKYHVIHNGGDTKFVEKVFAPEDMQEELHPSDRANPYMIAWNPGLYLDRAKLERERKGKAPFPYNQSEEEIRRHFGETSLPTQFSLRPNQGPDSNSPLYYLSGKDVQDQTKNEILNYFNDKDLDRQLRERLRIDDVTLQNLKPYIFGIMGVESNSQNVSAGRDIKERAARLLKSDPSLGPFQIRLSSVGDRARKAFDIYEQDDLDKDLRKGYIAAVDRMLEAKRVMDDRVAKGYHPELAKADPYARATYYYNQPQRALMSDEDYAKKNFVYQPFTIPNPVGKDWRFSTGVNASQDDVKSAYEKFLEESRLRGDRGSYMHKVQQAAYPLLMEVLDDEEPQFGIAEAQLPAVEVVGKRKPKVATRAKGGIVSTEGYRANSPDRFNAYNVIPSNQITMQGVPHPVVGIDNLGNRQVMLPGANYRFPGQAVLEVPMKGYRQDGGPVDETQTQINYINSLAKSPMTTKRLQGELHKEDVSAEKLARIQSLQDADVRYHKDLPSWIMGAYVPRQYKGMIFQDQAWKPAGLIQDPIYGVDKPGTVYLGTQFMPGKVPAAKDATTPSHEVAHSALDGDAYITEYATQLVHDATDQGDEPDRTQLYGKKFGYNNEPSEMIARMQAVRYLLNKNNIYDARTQEFDDDAYEKMMKDPMIQGNSDFQDFYKVLKGNDDEKKRWFMRFMNEIASRSNGTGSTIARYGGRVRYQQGGEMDYQPPQGYQPSTPQQRANWNRFLDYLESQGMAGNADLDVRDKHLGLQYLNTYNKAYPKAQVPESFIPTAQYENYLIRRQNSFPNMTSEQAAYAFGNLSQAYRQYPISGVDNWLGKHTSKEYYPTFERGKSLNKADGTKVESSYRFGENFEDYVRSREDPALEAKYLIKPSASLATKQLGGGLEDTGLYPYGTINPFDMDPSTLIKGASRAAAAPATQVATPVAPSMNDTGLYPYGVINPFDMDPYSLQRNETAKTTGVHSAGVPMSTFASKFTSPITIKEPSFPFTNLPPKAADTSTQQTATKKKSWWNSMPSGGDIASGLLSGMSILNTILESKDRNRYKNQVRIRSLGDAKGPVIPGDLDNLRGDYAVNEGYFRPNRYTPVQFGSVPMAQMGGGYYDVPVELQPIPEGPKPSIPATDPYANIDADNSSKRSIPDIKPDMRMQPNEAAWQAYDYYVHEKGLAPHMAAGIIGNLYRESGMDPTVREKPRPELVKKGYVPKGVGLAQWSADERYLGLLKYAKSNERDPNDLYTQLDFILEEPGIGVQALKALAKTRTPEEASYVFGKVYERPSEKYAGWDERAGIARKLFEGTLPNKKDIAGRAGKSAGGARFGGEQHYQLGGEYTVTPKQLEFILAHGGEVEIIPPVPLKGRLRSEKH